MATEEDGRADEEDGCGRGGGGGGGGRAASRPVWHLWRRAGSRMAAHHGRKASCGLAWAGVVAAIRSAVEDWLRRVARHARTHSEG
eukprot:2758651-Prymnesium_polylepis.1